MKKIAALLFVLLLPATGQAEEFRYSGVQASYGWAKFKDIDADFIGPGIGFAVGVTPSIYIGTGMAIGTDNDFQGSGLRATASGYGVFSGFHAPVSSRADVYVDLEYNRSSADLETVFSSSGIYYGFELGVRAWVAPGFEVNADIDYSRSDGSGESDPSVGAEVLVSENVGINFYYTYDKDVDVYEVGFIRYF